jgi:hypothetical protein
LFGELGLRHAAQSSPGGDEQHHPSFDFLSAASPTLSAKMIVVADLAQINLPPAQLDARRCT